MSAIRLLRVAGAELRVHVSWVVILVAIVVTTADRLGTYDPTLSPLVRMVAGGLVASAVLTSAIVHELGHVLMGRRLGAPAGPVVVHLFGAPASPSQVGGRPRDEFLIAAAGPTTNLLVGTVALALGGALLASGWAAANIAAQFIVVVGLIGIALGAVNLVPAFPLDGGRLVRAIGWARTGDPGRGLEIAAAVGRATGLVCTGIGTAIIILWSSVDGVMLALCGWFLVSSARGLADVAAADARLEGLSVADAMDAPAIRVSETLTLDTFADQVLAEPIQTVAVVRDDEIVGLLDARRLVRTGRDHWRTTRAGAVMTPLVALPPVAGDTSLRATLDLFQRSGLDGLAVTESGAVVGIVTRYGVGQAIRRRAAALATARATDADGASR